MPRAIFDFIDGGAEDEISLAGNRAGLDAVRFVPRLFGDVSDVDTGTELLGRAVSMPLAIGPTGWTRLAHPAGELGAAWAANEAGVPYTLATLGTVSPRDVQQVTPDVARWFQLYPQKDAHANEDLVASVEHLGFEAIMVTIDTAVIGLRRKDKRNGLTVPPSLRTRTVAEMMLRPRWFLDVLTTPPMGFRTLDSSQEGAFTDALDALFMQGVTIEFLQRLRERWPKKLIVKGISSVHDAELAFSLGVDAIVLSNHGGRQLDRAVAPITVLPQIRTAVGPDREVLIDGGIRSGVDIAATVASGATGCLIGRAYMYGLMAGGPQGVARTLEILGEEFRRTMQLLGARSVADLTSSLLYDSSTDVAATHFPDTSRLTDLRTS